MQCRPPVGKCAGNCSVPLAQRQPHCTFTFATSISPGADTATCRCGLRSWLPCQTPAVYPARQAPPPLLTPPACPTTSAPPCLQAAAASVPAVCWQASSPVQVSIYNHPSGAATHTARCHTTSATLAGCPMSSCSSGTSHPPAVLSSWTILIRSCRLMHCLS